METRTYSSWWITGLSIAALAASVCMWLPNGNAPDVPVAPGNNSDSTGQPAWARDTEVRDASFTRTALTTTDDAPRPQATRMFAGHVVQRSGGPLPPTEIFVDAPDRTLLSRADARRATLSYDIPPDGRFRFVLPGDLYEDVAFVNIVGGHGDMTLFTGLVKVEENAEIVVSGPDDEDSQPIDGTLTVSGPPVQHGNLLLMRQATSEPVSYQWGCEGNEIAVSLRVLKTRFADVVGPVVLRLDDTSGLHASEVFPSIGHLSRRLAEGLQLRPRQVELELPPLRPGVEVHDATLWSLDNARFPVREHIVEGKLRLRLTPGEYRVRGANPVHGLHALATFAYSGHDIDPVVWGFVGPGPHSSLLLVRDETGQEPVNGAKIEARLTQPEDPAVRPGWYRVSAKTGIDGAAHLAGLLPGSYELRISHSHLAEQMVSLRIPQQQTAQVTLQPTVAVAWQFNLPAGTVAAGGVRVFVRRIGGGWVAHDLGPGSQSGDYVLHAVPGTYDVACQSGRLFGHRTLRLTGTEPVVARVELREAPEIAGTVVHEDDTPASGMWLELVAADTNAVHARAVTDDAGEFRLTTSSGKFGDETLIVRDTAGHIVAEGAARNGTEIQIGSR